MTAKILVVSDDGAPSGYGRISMEVNTRLARRGYTIIAASVAYDGLLPPQLEGQPLPYWVGSLAGHPNWPEQVVAMIAAWQPDIVCVIQDATYAEPVRYAPIDWSRYGFVIVTPVDGTPIWPRWVEMVRKADAALTISEFGVEAYKKQGVEVGLCRPGVNLDKFFKLNDDQRNELRTRFGLKPDSFVIGSFCQNQGRKDIPGMIEGFYQFATDKPNARLYLDMDAVSPAGWDIRSMILDANGLDASKILFRDDALRAGLFDIRERYNLLDLHMVISHREGFGLPLAESQACGVATMAMDYCSGREVCGDDKGYLVEPIDYTTIGTWGGARDRFAAPEAIAAQLQRAYANPHERALIADRGMAYSRQHTWDAAADNVQAAIEKVMASRKRMSVVQFPVIQPPTPITPQPDGLKLETVPLVENVS